MKPLDRIGWGPTRKAAQSNDGWTVTVIPPFGIGPGSEVVLSDDQYQRYLKWRDGGMLIQDALPELSIQQREVLLTGLSDAEFKKFAREEE